MTDAASAFRTRLFTTFGTLVYVDPASGELRHGAIVISPANAVFTADLSSAGALWQGCMTHVEGGPVACSADRCLLASKIDRSHRSAVLSSLSGFPLGP